MATYNEIKERLDLTAFCEANLEKRNGRYICPVCKSGEGPNGTAAFSINPNDPTRAKCFSCNTSGDIVDWLAVIHQITKEEAKTLAEQMAGLPSSKGANSATPTNYTTRKQNTPQNGPQDAQRISESVSPTAIAHKPIKKNFTEGRKKAAAFIAEAAQHIEAPEAVEYIQSRGFTVDQMKEYGIGYNPKDGALVLPFIGSSYYTERYIDPSKHKNMRYTKPKAEEVGPQPVYNPGALKAKTFVLCEGILDALALKASGAEAMAICSTSSRATLAAIINARYSGVVFVAMDHDEEAGPKAQARIIEELTDAGIKARPFVVAYDPNEKDPADVFKNRPAVLAEAVKAAQDEAAQEAQDEAEKELEEGRTYNPEIFVQNLFARTTTSDPIKTGFKEFDEQLGGGLFPGLYVIGAASSIGKTTLTLQVADNIAAQGVPVLFVSVEQSGEELVAKSLARIMHDRHHPAPYQEILNNEAFNAWNEQTLNTFIEACNEYTRTIAPSLRINRPYEQPTAQDVEAEVAKMATRYGRPPVVFLDYLQLMKSDDPRDTDKLVIDKAVLIARRIADKYKTPVWLISSINRQNYASQIGPEAFKESGNIEFSADVLLGMQPNGFKEALNEEGEASRKRKAQELYAECRSQAIRNVDLFVLKNRNGTTTSEGHPITFTFNAPSSKLTPIRFPKQITNQTPRPQAKMK